MADIYSPHDKFFRETWSRKEVVKSFLENQVPKAVSACLNTESLHLENGSFIDTELKAHFSDMLYSLETKGNHPIQLYLLFEHKSYPDDNLFLQFLRYMLKIFEAEYKQNKQLVPILPLLLYHGKTGWQLKPAFQENFAPLPDVLKPFVLNFQLIVCDLTALRDEDITGEVLAKVAMLTLKHIFNPNLAERLPSILSLLKQLAEKETVLESLEVILRYVSNASQHVKKEDLKQSVEKILPEIGEKAMATLAQEWIAEGKAQGIQQGMQQGMQQGIQQGEISILLRLMRTKFGALSNEIETRINQANSEQLLSWSDNVLSAQTIDEIFH